MLATINNKLTHISVVANVDPKEELARGRGVLIGHDLGPYKAELRAALEARQNDPEEIGVLDLTDADLSEVNLSGCSLKGVLLVGVQLGPNPSCLQNIDLRGAIISNELAGQCIQRGISIEGADILSDEQATIERHAKFAQMLENGTAVPKESAPQLDL